jgi:hypothetical protein
LASFKKSQSGLKILAPHECVLYDCRYGIDLGGIIAGGGHWIANGGWQNGRKIVLGLTALVLGQSDLTALTAGVPVSKLDFSEDTEINVGQHAASPGGVLWCASLAFSPLPASFSYKSEKSLCGTGARRY